MCITFLDSVIKSELRNNVSRCCPINLRQHHNNRITLAKHLLIYFRAVVHGLAHLCRNRPPICVLLFGVYC